MNDSAARPEVPYRFEPTTTTAAIAAEHGEMEDGTESGVIVTIAGRLMLRRDQGKLAFGVLQDGTGRVQLFAPSKTTPDFEGFTGLSIGDWIGVAGEVTFAGRQPDVQPMLEARGLTGE